MIDLLKKLIIHKSDTPTGANEALQFCANWLEQQGIEVNLHQNNGLDILTAEIGQGADCLIWNGHVDVVPAAIEQYTPFVDGDLLFGRGAADMKAGVAAMMFSFVELSKSSDKLPRRLQLHLVTDEETGGENTSGWLVRNGYNGQFVICGEPTQLQIGLQAKGILQFEIQFKGKASHGSRPWEGLNAVLQAMHFHSKLLESPITNAHNTFYDSPSINLATIQAGERFNVVPDQCNVRYDIRYVPGQSAEVILHDIQKILDEEKIQAEIIIHSIAPAVTTSADDPFVLSLLKTTAAICDKQATLFGQHGSADTRFYAADGVGAIEFGPTGADWHGPAEYVSISSVYRYANIIKAHVLS
jgi:succinyl-diaminopimelate desuccinylase